MFQFASLAVLMIKPVLDRAMDTTNVYWLLLLTSPLDYHGFHNSFCFINHHSMFECALNAINVLNGNTTYFIVSMINKTNGNK